MGFANYAPFHFVGLHREHCLAINDRCRLRRQTGFGGAPHHTFLFGSRQIAADDLRRRVVTLDRRIGRRRQRERQTCGRAHAGRKLDHFICGLDGQELEHQPRQLHAAGTQDALAEPGQHPVARHLLSFQAFAGSRQCC